MSTTAPAAPSPRLLPRPLPGLHGYTLLSLLLIVFAGALVIAAPSDVDYWWHLKTGQWIAANGIPRVDPFSHTAGGRTWIDHEWLQQWLIQALDQRLGYAGPMLLYGAIQAATSLLVWRLVREHGAGRLLALVLLLAFFLCTAPTWGVRPQIVASLLLAIQILILSRHRRAPDLRSLWWLPLLIGLWANLHGSFMLGLAVIVVFAVGAALENTLQHPDHPQRLRPLVLVLVASTLATVCNPYGLHLLLLPFDYLTVQGDNPLHHIVEWKSPDFHDPTTLILPLSLLPLLLCGLPRDSGAADDGLMQRLDLTAALLVGAFTLMALSALYHYPLFGVVVLPIVAGVLSRAVPRWSSRQDEPVAPTEGRINLLLLPLLAPLIVGLLCWLPQAQTERMPRTDGTLPVPVSAAHYLATLPPGTRMFNDFGWGGFLIQRLYPQQQVFIDGRVDLYRDRIFADYLHIDALLPGWQALLKRYRVNAVIVRSGSALDGALAAEPHWTLGYRDPLAVVYTTAMEAGGPAETVQAAPATLSKHL